MLTIMSRKAAPLPDISRPTSKPSCMPSCFCTSRSGVSAVFTASVAPILRASSSRYGIQVGDDDVPRACALHHRDAHDADGARAGDQHIFAEHGKRERRVHGVAEGIEDGGDFLIDMRLVPPDVAHRQHDIFGEGAGAVDADARM